MRQFAFGKGNFTLFFPTNFNEEEIKNKFDPDCILDIKLNVTLADGSVHTIEGFEPEIEWLEFEEDQRECLNEG
jgi:hypothetical protein